MHDKLQILLHRTLDCYELLKSRDFSKHLYSFPLSQEQISQQFSSLSTTAIYHYVVCGGWSAYESGAVSWGRGAWSDLWHGVEALQADC